MALLEEHRNTIYNAFVSLMGKEATQAMLSQFPSRDLDEPVTREFLRAELGELRDQLTARMLTLFGLNCVVIALLKLFG